MGQPRPILDIVTDYDYAGPPPTPSPTPTMTVTPSVTPTYTPTITPTETPTMTPTETPTMTPTPSSTPPPAFNPDAQAFFDAVEGGGDTLTDLEKTAVNQLVDDLQSNSLWTLFDAFYPFVGGTSTSCKWNLKDPQDTDAAFRITWYGGMSFSSTGVLGNSSNSGGLTYLNPVTESYTEMCMGVYINDGFTPTPNGDYDMGGYDGDDFMISLGYANKTTKYACFLGTQYKTTTSGTYTKSLFMGQNNGTTTQLYQGSTQLISTGQSFASMNRDIAIGASWRGNIQESSGRGYGTAFLGGNYLDSTEQANLDTIITNFNDTLSR